MMRWIQSRRDAVDPWDDAPDDPLPADLAALAGADAPAVDAAVERRRAIVLAAYRAAAMDESVRAGGRQRLRLPARRRWAFAFVTAVLTLAMAVAGVAASDAGGPLYPLRLATEEAFLPAEGPDRLAAQLDRLDHRVQEAERARARGDRGGLEAALGAYGDIVRAVEAGRPEALDISIEKRSQFRERLFTQVRRLEGLATFDPAAIGNAVEAGRRLEARVQSQDGNGPGPGPRGDGGAPASPVATPEPSPDGQSPDPTGSGAMKQGPQGLGGRPDPGNGGR